MRASIDLDILLPEQETIIREAIDQAKAKGSSHHDAAGEAADAVLRAASAVLNKFPWLEVEDGEDFYSLRDTIESCYGELLPPDEEQEQEETPVCVSAIPPGYVVTAPGIRPQRFREFVEARDFA